MIRVEWKRGDRSVVYQVPAPEAWTAGELRALTAHFRCGLADLSEHFEKTPTDAAVAFIWIGAKRAGEPVPLETLDELITMTALGSEIKIETVDDDPKDAASETAG